MRLFEIDDDQVSLFSYFKRSGLVVNSQYPGALDREHPQDIFSRYCFSVQFGSFLKHSGRPGDFQHIVGIAGGAIGA
jgi:hypothetical protein